MRLISLARCAIIATVLFSSAAAAAPDPAAALAEFIKPLLVLPADSGGAWEDLEKVPAVRWAAGPPTMLDKPSPDGNFFARPGQATVGGRSLGIVASGARSMVFSIYLRDSAPPMEPEALIAGFRQAGFVVTPARCPISPGGTAPRRWYRLSMARKKPAILYAGPLRSGGSGYTLYLNDLPPLTPSEAALYTDKCPSNG